MMRCFCLTLVLFMGCSPSTKTRTTVSSDTTDAPKAKPKIALIMKSLANDFFSSMESGAKSHQQTNADTYDLISNGIKDESDLARQVALVDEMVNLGVNAIVIAPADSKALVPALRKAINAGVVVVNIDNRLDADVLRAEDVTIPFVGPDNQAGAKKVGDFLAGKLTKGDRVAILEGKTTAFNGVQRRLGFEAAMAESGIEIVSSQSAEWETNLANTVTSSILNEHPDLKAILAANDSMALGAVASVKSAGRTGDVLIVGFDNIPAVQDLIRDGKVLATVDQHADQLAVFGIETALRILQDPNQRPADVETPVDLIIADSLSD